MCLELDWEHFILTVACLSWEVPGRTTSKDVLLFTPTPLSVAQPQ